MPEKVFPFLYSSCLFSQWVPSCSRGNHRVAPCTYSSHHSLLHNSNNPSSYIHFSPPKSCISYILIQQKTCPAAGPSIRVFDILQAHSNQNIFTKHLPRSIQSIPKDLLKQQQLLCRLSLHTFSLGCSLTHIICTCLQLEPNSENKYRMHLT